MGHKRGRDLKANAKRIMRELHQAAYCTLTVGPFDAMLKAGQYAERQHLTRFAVTLPVVWPKTDLVAFVDEAFAKIHDTVSVEILESTDTTAASSGGEHD